MIIVMLSFDRYTSKLNVSPGVFPINLLWSVTVVVNADSTKLVVRSYIPLSLLDMSEFAHMLRLVFAVLRREY